jgi:hypothetical protein
MEETAMSASTTLTRTYPSIRAQRSSWLILAFSLAFLASSVASAQELGTIRFDNWLYYQKNPDNTGAWQYRPRFYIPVNLPEAWTFTQRIDLPILDTDKVGPDNRTGKWKAGLGDWFIEEGFTTPEVAKNLKLYGSVRFLFPTGGQAPFSASQYEWAPALSAIYSIPEEHITVSPLVRYFRGFSATEPNVTLVRRLDVFPTVNFGLADNWSLAFYNGEFPMSYNYVNGKWFVPIDAMLIKRLSKTVELGIGGAYGIVTDNPTYKYQVYGRLSYYF